MLFRVKGKRIQHQVIFDDGDWVVAKCIEGTVVFAGTASLFKKCWELGIFVNWPDNYM